MVVDLCIGQVHMIFDPPGEYIMLARQPLVYVEWFTPFQARNFALGMYHVARSTRSERQRASVIPLDHIIRTCHLVPLWGRRMDRTWSPENVLRLCTRFYVNPYLRHSDFVLFRLLLDRWLKTQNTR